MLLYKTLKGYLTQTREINCFHLPIQLQYNHFLPTTYFQPQRLKNCLHFCPQSREKWHFSFPTLIQQFSFEHVAFLSLFQAFDAFIYIFFALEMVIKMVALGIFGQRCYLGDTWNRLDFFIVMAGWVFPLSVHFFLHH